MIKNIQWKAIKNPMQIKQSGDLVYLDFPLYAPFGDRLLAAFSTRLGGVSQGYLGAMNLSFTRGDDPAAVRKNYRIIGRALGFDPKDIVASQQTHTTNVRVVTEADRGCGYARPLPYTDVDGMITNVPGLVLATFYADCVPVYFYDPQKGAIGLSHSGWKGTVGKISKETIRAMTANYGTEPADLYVAIGPSICQDCYEVSEDVIQQFQAAFSPDQQKELYYKKENGKYQLNLQKAIFFTLVEAGVSPDRIALPGICTCCNPDFLFSHRASKGKRGNLAAFMSLR